MREIILSKKSILFIKRLLPKHVNQIAINIAELKDNVLPNNVKKLKGYDYYRISSGEYRIIYQFDDNNIHIVFIGKRNDSEVYRKIRDL